MSVVREEAAPMLLKRCPYNELDRQSALSGAGVFGDEIPDQEIWKGRAG